MTMVTVSQAGNRSVELEGAEFVRSMGAARSQLAAPFSQARLDLAAKVGNGILREGGAGLSPAAVHFAYWTRSAALRRLADGFQATTPRNCLARPVGLVFHLPPQNVETVFLYSWILSFLAGNANVVRLPSALGNEMKILLERFLEEFENSGVKDQFFVGYDSQSEVSISICSESDARVVWGGDAKVSAFSDIPLRNGGKSIWFGDRFSQCVVDGAALAALNDDGRKALAEQFFNDIYVFEQMACSSPHIIHVVGDRVRYGGVLTALLDAIVAVANAKKFQPATGHAIRKIVEVFAAAGRGAAETVYWGDNVLTAAENISASPLENRVGGGYLEYRFIESIDDLQATLREHHQTLTYYGFDREVMASFASKQMAGGSSRIVPVGQALDFDFVWDGYDLPRELTQLIRIA